MPARSEQLRFTNGRGQTLSAKLERPGGAPKAWALFAHCFTCDKDTLAVARISRALSERGIAVVRFDFTGHGESEGDFSETHFTSNVFDVLAAAAYMRAELGAPEILLGHSLGGAAMLAAAGRIPTTKAVVAIAAPKDPAHLLKYLPVVDEIAEKGSAEIEIAGRLFKLKQSFIDDISQASLSEHLAGLKASLLLLHSPDDATIPFEHARSIYERVRGHKTLIPLPGADHLLTDRRDAEYAAALVAAWVERYLVTAPKLSRVAPHSVRVDESGPKYGQLIRTTEHRLSADEPRPHGADAGMNPYELLLAALGACTAMTLRMYADRKGWPLEHASVELKHQKVHAEDCAECETEKGLVDEITRVIELSGDLTQEQRKRLMDIAEKCPVHKTLHSEIRVKSKLA
jgi:uncharacterized OsmC-like protein/pimeloyl-ACP methyl ester carboxylesterase